MQAAFWKRIHAELPGDTRARARADGPHRVLHAVFQLHLLTALEEGLGITQDLRVERIRHRLAAVRLVDDRAVSIDLDQERIEIEVIQMRCPAADLLEQVGAADGFIERLQAKRGEDLANVFGDEAHKVDHLVRVAREVRAQGFVLRTHAHRTGVGMALAHHDAAHGDERRRTDPVFLRAQHGRNHNIPARAQAAICPQCDLFTEIIEREHLMGLC